MTKKETYKFNLENLNLCIEDVEKWEAKKKPQDCSICKSLNNSNSAYQETRDPSDNSYLPKSSERLESIWKMESKKGGIKKCPECDQIYWYESRYEWFSNGTEDEQHLKRITKRDVKKIIVTTLGYYVTPSTITHSGNSWKIVF